MPRLVLASDNPGKLRELRALLAPLQVVPQGDFGVVSAEEPHHTFVENALAKARHAARASRLPALADDSGLCCEALGGAPGVRSARFAGPTATDAQNNAELIRRLAGAASRTAHYFCVLVALRDADDPEPLIAVARWHGHIVDAPRGTGGFGYDPHFYLDEFNCTAAELAPERKNAISHRGQALHELRAQVKTVWKW
jgi:XTP/dITP diphosphohydrolase